MSLESAPPFVHLRVKSAYSLADGAIPVNSLVKLAAGLDMPAVALTDQGNLFGALEFAVTAADAGLQPVVGAVLGLNRASDEPGAGTADPDRLLLLAQDQTGYENLMALVSQGFLEGEGIEPAVDFADLSARAEGLIALDGVKGSPLGRHLMDGSSCAAAHLKAMQSLFDGRLYLEIQRHGQPHERALEARLLTLAAEHGLPIVATNDAHFAGKDQFEAHEVLSCIAQGLTLAHRDRRRLTPEHYFKTSQDMARLFADLPEAVENTWKIARRCAVMPRLHPPILPAFDDGSGQAETEVLARMAREGLDARLQALEPAADAALEQTYRDRLDFELGVIEQMGFPGYFLIVADFIQWAKGQGIPVGPGRGSGAGSLVAYSLTITDIDPLPFNLLFERFLNPERVSMPDFDIDFCQDRRDEVIAYVRDKYGSDRVAQIITFGKLQARAVVRDVGRVLGMPHGQTDRIAKLIPNNPAAPTTLAEAIAGDEQLQKMGRTEEIVAKLFDIGQRLEGLFRNASTHAAGVVIGDRDLTELVPLYKDPRSDMPATQFNMKWVEPAGLVKFDFLGLKTLTVIAQAERLIRRFQPDFDINRIPLDDPKVFEMLSRAESVGIFQLESTGMRDVLRKLRPDRFEDIIAVVALYRPGPMENIPTYISRKHGDEKVQYLHPLLEPIVSETYGIMIYQEQVMQAAQALAGYSLGGADLLRRAMGKKLKSEMDKQKASFVDGAAANDIKEAKALEIFTQIEAFAGYGFNKSHAAAYALVSYQTAYLKA
ncbi:MAG: DNA polymerase III subunit alpha, partial [Alphaproteobacteria bacterium]|nr:DNA polymerase III subunit alpha [Alphaproteobacteria bacterium]